MINIIINNGVLLVSIQKENDPTCHLVVTTTLDLELRLSSFLFSILYLCFIEFILKYIILSNYIKYYIIVFIFSKL
jgi:hypothetical protein